MASKNAGNILAGSYYVKMTKNQDIDGTLRKLKNTSRNNPSAINDIDIPSHIKNHKDIQKILEILIATDDINTQIKIFVYLSAWSLCDDKNLVIIIKFRALYDKINKVLETGLPRNAVHALNFITSLLQIEEEDDNPTRRKVMQYLRDKVRTSGCLGTMVNKFNRMMYIDTWNALCQCIAAACSNCTTNQTYCSLLIPVCIQKCSSTNKHVFLVLQNLLRNHNANMQLFIESNGFAIFTRELLQYDKCMQLLRTVVLQYPDKSQLLVRQTKVLNILREFVRIYGCGSEIGHKATIILHHIESRASDLNLENVIKKKNPHNNISPNIVQTTENDANMWEARGNVDLDDTATLLQNIAREVNHFNLNEVQGKVTSKANNSVLQNIFKPATAENHKKKLEQAKASNAYTEPKRKELKITIAQESTLHRHNQHRIRSQRKIITKKSTHTLKGNNRQYQTKELHRKSSIEPSFSFLENQNKQQQTNTKPPSNELSFSFLENNNTQYNHVKSQKPQRIKEIEPSFSFLENMNVQLQRQMNREPMETEPEEIIEPSSKKSRHDRKNTHQERPSIEPSFSFLENPIYKPVNKKSGTKTETKTDMHMTAKENIPNRSGCNSKSSTPGSEFDPVFSSTFVQERYKRKKSGTSTQSKTTKRRRVEKRSISREPENDGDVTLRNTSLNSSFISIISNSCTSFVKSVTSIFGKKKTDHSFRASVSPKNDKTSYSFSFQKCVNKQDAINNMSQRKRNKDNSMFSTESCDTCDDTQELKKKLRTDEKLKQTVKKLKMGINMFGCNFKKISHTMWPRDTYMKPEVLYKLYRKLLAK